MNVLRWVGGAFAMVGIMLLVIAWFLHHGDAAFAAKAHAARGQVIELIPNYSDGSTTYASRVRFMTNEASVVDFVDSVSSYPARHDPGEWVALLYDPRRPTDAIIDDFWGRHTGTLIVGGLGTVFAPLGLILLWASIRGARRDARLRRGGRAIEAEFLHVFRDEQLSINGRHPFRIAAQAPDPDTGALRRFDSPPIWVDPTDRLRGRPLKVLLGRHAEYLVDLRGIVDDAAFADR